MNRSYDKPFIDYDGMINLMQSSNIDIDNREFAIQSLREYSYYTLVNGYKDTFLAIPGTDCFRPGTNFSDILTLHLIDVDVNVLVLKYILSIENSLKSKLAYLISEKYGVWTDVSAFDIENPNDYLCRSNYSNNRHIKPLRNNRLKRIKKNLVLQCRGEKKIRSEALKHYIEHHNHIPPWILMTEIPFADAINWYSILQSKDKDEITDLFLSSHLSSDDKKEFLKQALELLRQYRNKIAHNHRTFNVRDLPVLPKTSYLLLTNGSLSESEYNNNFGKADLYGVLNACLILFGSPYLGRSLIRDLHFAFDDYIGKTILGQSILSIFGLPEDIFERLEKVQEQKFPNLQ